MFLRRDKEKEKDKKIEASLARTRQRFFGRIASLLGPNDGTPAVWAAPSPLLIPADGWGNTALELGEARRAVGQHHGVRRADQVQAILKEKLVEILDATRWEHAAGPRLLTVILIVGVNGSGKTTSIGKLAQWHKHQGRRVTLAAADTFRAAAIDQLKIWGERAGVEVIAGQPGADPGAIVYDAIRACQSRGADVLIVDTAGRLHTKFNLMKELEKIRSIAAKQVHKAPHETLLVLDATTGQNGLSQARVFKEAVEITGLILTKLDGTAKGGIAFAISKELGIPIQFVGTGEKLEDFAEFDATEFVEGLFATSDF